MTLAPQFDARDTETLRIQLDARPPEYGDEFLHGLIEDHEDITISDKRLFSLFIEKEIFDFSGLWESITDLCFELASADPEDLGGECKAAHKVRAHLLAALKKHARELAQKEIEKDGMPDIYASDFYR